MVQSWLVRHVVRMSDLIYPGIFGRPRNFDGYFLYDFNALSQLSKSFVASLSTCSAVCFDNDGQKKSGLSVTRMSFSSLPYERTDFIFPV